MYWNISVFLGWKNDNEPENTTEHVNDEQLQMNVNFKWQAKTFFFFSKLNDTFRAIKLVNKYFI